jgi:beta-carotene 3-hydroxylase
MDLSTIIICSAITVVTFLCWEFVAWFTHRFIMHGILWSWHKSHHTIHQDILERNDLFALVFSLPSIGLFYYFSQVTYNPYMLAIALGIFLYGLFYLVFHDVIVHQRITWRPRRRSRYLQRIINAHYIHHSQHTKRGCEAFGFLFAPKKYEPRDFILRTERNQTQ